MMNYKIGGQEYSASHEINTTVFLERFRCTQIAIDFLAAYILDEENKKRIDSIFHDTNNNLTAISLTLPFMMDEFIDAEMGAYLSDEEIKL